MGPGDGALLSAGGWPLADDAVPASRYCGSWAPGQRCDWTPAPAELDWWSILHGWAEGLVGRGEGRRMKTTKTHEPQLRAYGASVTGTGLPCEADRAEMSCDPPPPPPPPPMRRRLGCSSNAHYSRAKSARGRRPTLLDPKHPGQTRQTFHSPMSVLAAAGVELVLHLDVVWRGVSGGIETQEEATAYRPCIRLPGSLNGKPRNVLGDSANPTTNGQATRHNPRRATLTPSAALWDILGNGRLPAHAPPRASTMTPRPRRMCKDVRTYAGCSAGSRARLSARRWSPCRN